MHSTFERRVGMGSKAVTFGFFVVLALTFFAFVGNAKAAIETAPPPQIWSDKADYAPGEAVVLSGANWAPGDSVHIRVNDDAGATWSRDVDVTADASGAISDQFNLPDWFVATYSVTATGAQSGTARIELHGRERDGASCRRRRRLGHDDYVRPVRRQHHLQRNTHRHQQDHDSTLGRSDQYPRFRW